MTNHQMKKVVLFSGGLNSYIHLVWAVEKYGSDNILALYVDESDLSSKKELRAVRLLTQFLKVTLQVHSFQYLDNMVIDYCNKTSRPILKPLLLTALSSLYSDTIIYSLIQYEDNDGKTKENIKALRETVKKNSTELITPFANKTKSEIVKWYVDRGYSIENLKSTVSNCSFMQESNLIKCGMCEECFMRWVAMTNSDIGETYHLQLPQYKFRDDFRELLKTNSWWFLTKKIVKNRKLWGEVWAAYQKISKKDLWSQSPFKILIRMIWEVRQFKRLKKAEVESV